MLTNRNFICMTISFTCLYSIYTGLGAIVDNLLDPFGYSALDSSIIGVTFIFCGLIGSFVTSVVMDKTKKYLTIFRVVSFGSLIITSGFYWTLPSGNMFILVPHVALIGAFIIPIIPLGYAFSVELTYPVSEVMSNGFIVFVS